MKAIELALKLHKKRSKYFKEYRKIAREIGQYLREYLQDENLKVVVFGSVIRGEASPLSDIDMLIVSEKLELNLENLREVRLKVKEFLNDFSSPIEIHIATPELFEKWYKKFLDAYEVVS